MNNLRNLSFRNDKINYLNCQIDVLNNLLIKKKNKMYEKNKKIKFQEIDIEILKNKIKYKENEIQEIKIINEKLEKKNNNFKKISIFIFIIFINYLKFNY